MLLCPDILEHLVDPWRTLRQWSTYLKPGGRLLISIPNIREISVMWKIWGLGDFGYTEDGILDKTHLRFFARRNAAEIPNQDQYSNVKVIPALSKQQGIRIALRLVDNSKDGDAPAFIPSDNFHSFHRLRGENHGFSHANNLGLADLRRNRTAVSKAQEPDGTFEEDTACH